MDSMPPEMLERMHGAIRYLKSVPGAAGAAPPHPHPQPGFPAGPDDLLGAPILARPQVPWWDPGADTSVSPETDHVVIDGVNVARGSRVRMRPGSRRADAQDLFLVGRTALVEAVLHDVDGQVHVAVTPDHDPVGRSAAQPWPLPLLRPGRDRAHRPARARRSTRPGRACRAHDELTRGEGDMISRLVKAALLAALLAVIVQSLPDIKRYLELREM